MEKLQLDKHHKEWILSYLGLLLVEEGVSTYVDSKASEFHQILIRDLGSDECTTATCENALNDIFEHTNTAKLCDVCTPWFDKIIANTRQDKTGNLCRSNTNHRLWQSDKWEVMKIYMGQGSEKDQSVDDADIQDMLKLFISCSFFKKDLFDISHQLLQARNQLVHGGGVNVKKYNRLCLSSCYSLLYCIRGEENVDIALNKITQLQRHGLSLANFSNREIKKLRSGLEWLQGYYPACKDEFNTELRNRFNKEMSDVKNMENMKI